MREYTDDEIDAWREAQHRPAAEVARELAATEGWLAGAAFAGLERAVILESRGRGISASGVRKLATERLTRYRELRKLNNPDA